MLILRCSKCKIPQSSEHFYKRKDRPRGFQSRCKACMATKNKTWWSQNGEKKQAYAQKHYQNHKETINAKTALYAAQHPRQCRAWEAAYRRRHPEIGHAKQARRRAKLKQAAVNDFTALQWVEMQIIHEHKCVYCHKRCKGKLTQDHLTPLSQGGMHTKSNILPACRSCNSRKNNLLPIKPVQPLLL